MDKARPEIGARLRQVRQKMNLTQGDAAATLQITRQALAKIEAGEVTISVDRLMQLCELYGASYDYVLLGRERFQSCPTDGRLECRIVRMHSPCGTCTGCRPETTGAR